MSREQAMAAAARHFDDGGFLADLARRVAIRTESQNPDRRAALYEYLEREIGPSLAKLGYVWRVVDNPKPEFGPFLIAERMEGEGLPSVLTYGHGDVIRGQDASWRKGLSPWSLVQEGERIYGRGTADNKGQHSINMAALAAVIGVRGRLGFNSRILIETGEETGSAGLREVCQAEHAALKADVLIGSDGPRVKRERPCLFMGTRGTLNFDLGLTLREGGHHSGNWGGLLANPGIILAHAIASIVSARGEILIPELKPKAIPNSVRHALRDIELDGGAGAPAIDPEWGERGLTPVERVFAWNTFEVLAYRTGDPDRPVNAVPAKAAAHCQIRYTVDTDPAQFLPAIRRHLDAHGFGAVEVAPSRDTMFVATRLDPDHPYARWAARSLAASAGRAPDVIPNLGGSLPNDVFTDVLGLPTLWVPHSYSSCSQHAPNEHLLAPLVREGLQLMAGLFWDVGEGGLPKLAPAKGQA
ncbi:MAG TPA: M20 family metallopeptidase [Candidatus Cybelea sp.]|nr:M20 family metallopeptidase [Candidatus Cybelea sp.]